MASLPNASRVDDIAEYCLIISEYKKGGIKILNTNTHVYFGYFFIPKLSIYPMQILSSEDIKILNTDTDLYFGYFLITKLFEDTLSLKGIHVPSPSPFSTNPQNFYQTVVPQPELKRRSKTGIVAAILVAIGTIGLFAYSELIVY